MRARVGPLLLALLGCATLPPREGPRPAVVGRVAAHARDPRASENVSLQAKLRGWEREATEALHAALTRHGYPPGQPSERGTLVWDLDLDVTYGNRAMRVLTQGRVGGGSVRATLTARARGREHYRAVVERETAVTRDGSEFQYVIDEVLDALPLPEEPDFAPGRVVLEPLVTVCRADALPEWEGATLEQRRALLRGCRRPLRDLERQAAGSGAELGSSAEGAAGADAGAGRDGAPGSSAGVDAGAGRDGAPSSSAGADAGAGRDGAPGSSAGADAGAGSGVSPERVDGADAGSGDGAGPASVR